MSATRDRWAEWLAVRRFGGDPEIRRRNLERLAERRERVLDLTNLAPGETLLDVGCGEGLIGFGALESGAGHVVFSDVSTDLLDFCREAATELGVLDRCSFVELSAEDMHELEDASVDVVTTRSVLIFVADKPAAFAEFARVLRPGGRISLFEPINRFAHRPGTTWMGYELAPLGEAGERVRAVYTRLQPSETDPMLDFDERDLIRLAEEAGFFPIHAYLEAEIRPMEPLPWQSFLAAAGNPNIPTFAEAMEQVLTPAEQNHVSEYLRPLIEEGGGEWRMATLHLAATKRAAA